jgi:hypothetical protein
MAVTAKRPLVVSLMAFPDGRPAKCPSDLLKYRKSE